MKQTKKQQQLYTTVLHKIYTRHEISRIDIARETGITPATVSLITADMLSERLIQEIGEEGARHRNCRTQKDSALLRRTVPLLLCGS